MLCTVLNGSSCAWTISWRSPSTTGSYRTVSKATRLYLACVSSVGIGVRSLYLTCSQWSLYHMACCLSRYRSAYIADGLLEDDNFSISPGFTSIAFDQQLKRALAGHEWVRDTTGDGSEVIPPPYDIRIDDDSELVDLFERHLESSEPFSHFLPWDLKTRGTPFKLVRRRSRGQRGSSDELSHGGKRGRDGGAQENEPPAKRHKDLYLVVGLYTIFFRDCWERYERC